MLNLVLFILASYGLTLIVTGGHIFSPVREIVGKIFTYNPLECAMCFSFWSGVLLYYLFWVFGVKFIDNLWAGPIFGFISSGSSYALCSLIDDNGFRIVKKIDD
jgi:hypothetical protein